MDFFDTFIEARIELFSSTEKKDSIEDVIFTLNVNSGEVVESSIFLTPIEGLKKFSDKSSATEKVLDSIIDKSFFTKNSIDLTDVNFILYFSFDLINSVDSCYVINYESQSQRTIIYDIHGKRIIDSSKTFPMVNVTPKIEQSPFYLFFDTETTGLPINWKAPVTDLNNWPRMIQIAWILSDANGKRIESNDYIIRPENFEIPSDASKVHRITTEMAVNEGKDLENILIKFNELVERSDFIIAHNISFDEKILGAELLRKNIKSNFNKKRKLCTMQSSTDYCRLPGPYGYKWPKLSELHIKLFGKDFEEAHDASVDINATEKCFWEMRKIGLI